MLVDLASSNGTTVQGERISRRKLIDGDVIHLGPRVSFRFSMVDSAQQTMMMRLYESSTRDALTGAASRKHFDERLRSEVAYAIRHGAELALLMLDIDSFKRINDTFGHPAGDAVLRFVAGTVQAGCAPRTCSGAGAARSSPCSCAARPCRRRARCGTTALARSPDAEPRFEGKLIPATASFGCASVRCSPTATPDELVTIADRRLYQAKRTGRNRVVAED